MTKNGFTAIELLLSIATMATLALVVASLVASLGQARARAETALGVQEEGERVLARIGQTIRDAKGVSAPLAGMSGSVLTLQMDDPSKNPTTFSTDGSQITIRKGTGSAVPLTSSRVIASDVSIANTGQSDTHGSIRITFTLSAVNASGRPEYAYAHPFTTSVSLRR